jgi:hypothetical protein
MKTEAFQIVKSPELIAGYFQTLSKVIPKTSQDGNSLIKQEGWIGVCAHENKRDLRAVLDTIQRHKYADFIAIEWNMLEPRAMKVPSTPEGMDQFHSQNLHWMMLFAGKPDWIILFVNPLDFWLVAGTPDFVEEVLTCPPDEAFSELEEIVAESTFFTDVGRAHFSHLIHQLRFVYPAAQPGEAIDFEFT